MLMRKKIYLWPLLLLLSCQSQPDTSDAGTGTAPISESSPAPQATGSGTIKSDDSSLYAPEFLAELGKSGKRIRLRGAWLIIGPDSAKIPSLEGTVVYEGKKGKNRLSLRLEPMKLSMLRYHFERWEQSSRIDSGSGVAMLNPDFYLGTEIDEDDRQGAAYPCVEFFDLSPQSNFRIRFATEKDASGAYRAKISYDWGGARHLSLDDCPTLYGK